MVGRIRRSEVPGPCTTSPERAPHAMDRHVHSGSAPRVSHPLGGFLANPGFATFGATSPWPPTCRCRSGPFPFKVPPAGIARPFRDRWLPRRSVWRRVRVRSLPALRPIACPDLPGLPLTPATFRPTLTEAPGLLPCVLVCGRPRRSSRSCSRARATFHQGRNPGLLVTRRHGEPCSPSRRSVDLGAFFLPRARRPSSGLLLARGS